MSHRHSRYIRFVVLSLVALVAAAFVPSLADATPGRPAPTIQSVQKKLSDIQKQNSTLVEKYNQAKTDLSKRQKAATQAQQAAVAAAAAFEQAREAVSATALADYQGGTFSTVGALMQGSNQQNYLQTLSTQSMIARHTAQVAQSLDAADAAATAAQNKADALVKAAAARVTALKKQKDALDKAFAKYSALLRSLTPVQRQAVNGFSTTPNAVQVAIIKTAVSMTGVPGAAQKAVDFALAQKGLPYVYGSAGPGSYDCSGLTMAAYAQAGISLPHSAADQYNYGTHIQYSSVNDLMTKLKPGDLIFYYSPIGHVVIYVGGGQAMSASTEGVPIGLIDVAGWDANQITGATRIVG